MTSADHARVAPTVLVSTTVPTPFQRLRLVFGNFSSKESKGYKQNAGDFLNEGEKPPALPSTREYTKPHQVRPISTAVVTAVVRFIGRAVGAS
jgi:hypothetical protein